MESYTHRTSTQPNNPIVALDFQANLLTQYILSLSF
jgi:hypothetical protein